CRGSGESSLLQHNSNIASGRMNSVHGGFSSQVSNHHANISSNWNSVARNQHAHSSHIPKTQSQGTTASFNAASFISTTIANSQSSQSQSIVKQEALDDH